MDDRPLDLDELERAAHRLVQSLGISLFVRDGKIWQHGPGKEFIPEPWQVSPHGRFEIGRTEPAQ